MEASQLNSQTAGRDDNSSLEQQIAQVRIQLSLLSKAVIENGQAIASLNQGNAKQAEISNLQALQTIQMLQRYAFGHMSAAELLTVAQGWQGGAQ